MDDIFIGQHICVVVATSHVAIHYRNRKDPVKCNQPPQLRHNLFSKQVSISQFAHSLFQIPQGCTFLQIR